MKLMRDRKKSQVDHAKTNSGLRHITLCVVSIHGDAGDSESEQQRSITADKEISYPSDDKDIAASIISNSVSIIKQHSSTLCCKYCRLFLES